MKTNFLLSLFFLLLMGMTSYAQSTCGAVPGRLNNTWTQIDINDTTATPTYSVSPAGLPNTEFLVYNPQILADDMLGGILLGPDEDGRVTASDFSLGTCDEFCVIPISYDLQQIKVLVHTLLTDTFQTGVTCCQAASTFFPDICDSLIARGITDSSDVTTLADLYTLVDIVVGSGTTISAEGFVTTLASLNTGLSLFGNCSGGITQLCYALDSSDGASDCYAITNTAVPATSITLSPDTGQINQSNASVQFNGVLAPAGSSDSVVYYIEGGTTASIDPSTGLATGNSGADTLWVIAYAPNSCVSDTAILVVDLPSSTINYGAEQVEIRLLEQPVKTSIRFEVIAPLAEQNFTATLYHLNGQLLLQRNFATRSGVQELSVQQLPAGMYILNIANEAINQSLKVLKY